MLLKGFFGNTEKNNARAFRIACQEYSNNNTDSELCNTRDVAGIVLSDLAKTRGYLAKNDPRLYMLGICRVRNNNPLQIMRESTCLLQYYNIVPEQLGKQFKNNKKNIRLNLHGYNKGKSVEEVMQLLNYISTHRDMRLTIITGRGNHSPGHNPTLKPYIWSILEELAKGQTFSIEYKENAGGGAFSLWLKR